MSCFDPPLTLARLSLLAVGAVCSTMTAAPALAEDQPFCAERPGQTTPPCIMPPARFMIETGLADWTHTNDGNSKSDILLLGDSLLRAGLSDHLELQLGWTPVGIARERDGTSRIASRRTRTGDITAGFLYGLTSDGPVAIQAFVSLPTGKEPIGAGDWGAGLRLPVAFNGPGDIQFSLTPEIDAAVNGSGSGRHLAFGGAAGIGIAVTKDVQASFDVAAFRDEDPSGRATTVTSGLSLAWQAGPNTQFDVGEIAGLNASSPDIEAYVGIARRF